MADLWYVPSPRVCLLWRYEHLCVPPWPHNVGRPADGVARVWVPLGNPQVRSIFYGRGRVCTFRRAYFFVTRLEHTPPGGVSAWHGAGMASMAPGVRLGVNGKSVENAIPTRHARGPVFLPRRPAGLVNIAHMTSIGAVCRVCVVG